jgi:hypothetical protein
VCWGQHLLPYQPPVTVLLQGQCKTDTGRGLKFHDQQQDARQMIVQKLLSLYFLQRRCMATLVEQKSLRLTGLLQG